MTATSRNRPLALHLVPMVREVQQRAGSDTDTKPAEDSVKRAAKAGQIDALRLVWCFGPLGRRQSSVPLEKRLVLGRASADALTAEAVRIADPELSREHFTLEPGPEGWALTDTSTNGTFVDGYRAPKGRAVLVGPNTVVRAGDCVLVVARRPHAPFSEGNAPIGGSAAASETRARIAQIAPLEVPVLILGETGAGKEYVARAIHARSLRNAKPFVWVNCSELDRELARSELFGTRKGAFTDSTDSAGVIASAHEGTLFLDEIGNLSRDVQGMLLRFLDDGNYRRVGGGERASTARIIAATNRDLEQAIRDGSFRDDFLARLRAALPPITLRPLRERRDDILDWCDRYFETDALKITARRGITYSAGFAEAILLHAWPRNLRALHEALAHALLSASNEPLEAALLPAEVQATRSSARRGEVAPTIAIAPTAKDAGIPHDALVAALRASDGVMRQAAKMLGVDRTKVYRAAKKHGVQIKDYRTGAHSVDDDENEEPCDE